MSDFLLMVMVIIVLLTIASYSSVIAARFRFPYTILLFIIGIIIVSFSKYIPSLQFLSSLELSKEMVFFLFLPTLLFESGYNMAYQKVLKDSVPITALAVFSLLISTLLIGFGLKWGLYLIGVDIPYMVSFLFGTIISATDPVAVIAMFKDFGVPKRLTYLFEGESLMNDGTAVALFFIVMGIIDAGSVISLQVIGIGVVTFLSMIIGGIIFGFFIGVLFAKMIQWVKHSWAELTLTLIMAHTTFILAELVSEHFAVFKVSAIIATTIAAITLGNYGRFKISQNVRQMMKTTWGYFAFVSNSLIFLLMGMMIGNINFRTEEMFLVIVLAIVITATARAISVFGVLTPLNIFLKHPIPRKWQALLSWGSLRGAIAITMILFIPESLTVPGWNLSLSVREFISILVIACIIFTLLIKAVSIKSMIQKMEISKLSRIEEFTLHQIKEIIDRSILRRLRTMEDKQYVPESVSEKLVEKYEFDDEKELLEIENCGLKQNDFEVVLRQYALGIERQSAIEAYESRQISERTLKKILYKIENQYLRLSMGEAQTKNEREKKSLAERVRNCIRNKLYYRCEEDRAIRDYSFYRTRTFIAQKVIEQFRGFREEFADQCHSAFAKIIKQYEEWHDAAHKKMYALEEQYPELIHEKEMELLNSHLVYLEQGMLEKMHSRHIINGKVHKMLQCSIWEE